MSLKNHLSNLISEARVFRTGTIIEAAARAGMSKRSADYFIKELVDRGLIAPVHRGVYYIKHPEKPVSRSEIAAIISPRAIVSLDTACIEDKSNIRSVFHLVTDNGRIGSFESPLGPIAIHGIPKALLTNLESEIGPAKMYQGYDGYGQVKVASKEVSLIHISHLNNERKRGKTYGHSISKDILLDVDFEQIKTLSQKLNVELNSDLFSTNSVVKTESSPPSIGA